MNDDRLLSEIRAWLQDAEVPLPDAEQAGREIRVRISQTRRPRFTLWSLRKGGGARSAPPLIPESEVRPSPVPVTTGHAHIVIGRTQSMFTPARIVAVGLLAFAVGGAMVISQPIRQPAVIAPGAQSSAKAAVPVAFTGTGSGSTCEIPATTESDGPVAHTRGASCGPTYTFSDPRLDGTVSWLSNDDEYTDGSGLFIQSVALSIENDEGAWRMIPILSAKWPDQGTITDDPARHFFLVGEGAYDGLIAVVDGFSTNQLNGFIIDGEFPPSPENAYSDQP